MILEAPVTGEWHIERGIRARVLADTYTEQGDRLTTLELRFHRFTLPHLLTHRKFSRNGASSRATPTHAMIDRVAKELAFPIQFGTNQPGMQAGPPLSGRELEDALMVWNAAALDAIHHARHLADLNVHKEVVNRLLEPYAWQTMILSSTEWKNYFGQRGLGGGAQPESGYLAWVIAEAIAHSQPTFLPVWGWHLPLLTETEHRVCPLSVKMALSVARCARVSHLTHDGRRDLAKDLELYLFLVEQEPPHWSPLEHVATPCSKESAGNFDGYRQLRHSAGLVDEVAQAALAERDLYRMAVA